jgi:hypothetical protein
MPTNKLISSQLSAGQLSAALSQIAAAQAQVIPAGQNLTPEERQRFGSINEQNKLLVTKVLDYRRSQPDHSTPDVDWPTFELSWATRNGFAQIETLCQALIEICSDARILHDYFLYQSALADYNYSKYKAENGQGGAAYTSKVEEIKQFFPNTGGTGNGTTPAPADTEAG